MIWPFKTKQFNPTQEVKHLISSYYPGFIINPKFSQEKILSANEAIGIYESVAPVANAVDLIVDEASSISPIILETNNDTKQVISESPLLDKLNMPNSDMTMEDFYKAIESYYLIAGEVFIIATGDVDKEPAELWVVSPSLVTESDLVSDGMVNKFQVVLNKGHVITFNRDRITDRYYNNDGTAELWQIKRFNPRQTGRGFSLLNQMQKEVALYQQCTTHNLAMLEKGMRPSGAVTSPTVLTGDQKESLIETVKNFYSGGNNAGNVLFLEDGLDFKEMSIGLKDMDFPKLINEVTKTIYKKYKIPLPLIESDTMTFSNYETAQLSLYDKTVIPLSKTINKELTKFLAERYSLPENQSLSINMEDITALNQRRYEETKMRQTIGVETIDELRSILGREQLQNGGEFVYMPATMLPIGSDAYTEDNERIPQSNDQDSEETLDDVSDDEVQSSGNLDIARKEFISLLQNQKDKQGNRVFSDEEIIVIADEEGLK